MKVMNERILPPLSVSEYIEATNMFLAETSAEVVGEVAEYKNDGKWVGFSLRDKNDPATLKCVVAIWDFRKMGVTIEDGMEVKVGGNPRISKKWGSFSFWVTSIEPVGEGSLKKAYQALLKKLEVEGLYARKRVLPEFAESVGLVTSLHGGVVVHDFTKNLIKRGIKVYAVNTRVEGSEAVSGIVSALEYLNANRERLHISVIVLARGGGSLESMQAFNNEVVARAVFTSMVPVVAGIGHDVDVPIAALVADAMASTPTGAAHIINESWGALDGGVPLHEQAIFSNYEKELRASGRTIDTALGVASGAFRMLFEKVDGLTKVVPQYLGNLARATQGYVNRRDSLFTQTYNAFSYALNHRRETIERLGQIIEMSSPERNLRLGYAIALGKNGRVLKSVKDVKVGDEIQTKLADGILKSRIVK